VFGCLGITLGDKKRYHKPYKLIAREDTWLAGFSKFSY
jgi:hypothetical protein